MASNQKKPSPAQATKMTAAGAQSAAKIATNSANKAAAAALSAVESTRSSAESMMKFSTDTMKDIFANSSEEAQKAHEKAYAVGRESAENISRSVDALARTVNDIVSVMRENADAAIEVGHITSDIAKSITSELMEAANSNFADNVELCKEFYACRNANDLFDLQSKWVSHNIDIMFGQTSRMAEMLFQLATEAAEPINERVAEATERFSKSLAA